MRLTIIREDNIVSVDKRVFKVDIQDLPENFRALQWDGVRGHIEWTHRGNTEISDIDDYQHIVYRWQAVKDAHEASLIPPEPTEAELIAKQRSDLTCAIQDMLNVEAKKERDGARYDDIKSARAQASYPLDGTETPEETYIVMEARKLAKWELQVWGKSLKIEKEVLDGLRPIPTAAELLAELPIFGG